jgi:protein O-mannosyl-transferase
VREAGGTGRIAAAATPAAYPPWLLSLVLAIVIAAAGAWAYSTSLRGVFVLDDVRAIVRNPTIRTLWPPEVPLSPPSGSTVAGRPVANLSFAISYAAGPSTPTAVDPASFHIGNILIHLAAALVLFGVIRRTLSSLRLRQRFGHAASWLAAACALLWVVHPLGTAAVTYVVQRVESFMSLFYLLTLYCAIRADAGRRARWWAAGAIVSCACGMATKEVMVTAPVMVAIWMRLFGAAGRAEKPGRAGWNLVAGLASTWLILAGLVAFEHRAPSVSLEWSAVWSYLLTQTAVLVHYVRLALPAAPLVFLYDWPLQTSLGLVMWQAGVMTPLALATVVGIVKRNPASFLGAWFFVILAPSSSVLPIVTEVAAEHRMYLPLAAIIVAVVTTSFVAVRRAAGASRSIAIAGALVVVIAAGTLGAETRDRNRVYWSAVSLWQDTVGKRPGDARSRVAYGEALAGAGQIAEAEAQLRTAVGLAPGDPAARVRLGSVLAQQGKLDAAVPQLETALTLRPGDVDAHRFLASIYSLQRQDSQAVLHYEKAIEAVPDDVRMLAEAAAVLAGSSDPAVKDTRRALKLAERAAGLTSGRDPRVLEILSGAQAACGDRTGAARTARTGEALARQMGDAALASSLAYRASAYESGVR